MSDYRGDVASDSEYARANKMSTEADAANCTRLERKTVTKLDLLLVPSMSILYLLAFLDRTNVGNARVAGLQSDLGISDHQYQTGKFTIAVRHVKYSSLIQGSAHGDLRTVHSSRTSLQLDPQQDRSSRSASYNLHLVGSCVVFTVASEHLLRPTCMSFLPRAR
jgi:hypothetical protein